MCLEQCHFILLSWPILAHVSCFNHQSPPLTNYSREALKTLETTPLTEARLTDWHFTTTLWHAHIWGQSALMAGLGIFWPFLLDALEWLCMFNAIIDAYGNLCGYLLWRGRCNDGLLDLALVYPESVWAGRVNVMLSCWPIWVHIPCSKDWTTLDRSVNNYWHGTTKFRHAHVQAGLKDATDLIVYSQRVLCGGAIAILLILSSGWGRWLCIFKAILTHGAMAYPDTAWRQSICHQPLCQSLLWSSSGFFSFLTMINLIPRNT